MCGIMGYIGKGNAVPVIIDGLSKLEYRGYDSSGIALYNNNQIETVKKKGRLSTMVEKLEEKAGIDIGIGHTRWATHGVPSDVNAHPHADCTGQIVVVHNGIIENYAKLRKDLMLEGHDFISDTDTEAIVHLIEKYYKNTSLEKAVRKVLKEVQGSFAIAVMCVNEPDKIIAAKKDSPLIVGLGENENYIASDIPAILGKTKQIYILEDKELVILTKDSVEITDFDGNKVHKEIFEVTWDAIAAEKAGYEHFMLKEIHEQPVAIKETLREKIKDGLVDMSDLNIDEIFEDTEKIYIVACGTAYHAGLVGKLAIEKLAKIPVETDIASEFRYRDVLWTPKSVMIVVSQSGETADTLAALREAKRNGIKVLAVTNVVGSSVSREADKVIYTHAGPEIAVASTKAYTTQLVIMYLLALHLANVKSTISKEEITKLNNDLLKMDTLVEKVLTQQNKIKALAEKYKDIQSTFFLGRSFDYAVAMEGALKLKEISYIHAEAYAAGELKHGPLALIYDGVPVLALITQDHLVDKTMSNIKEVKARGAVVVAICKENLQETCQECDEQILLPDLNPILAPIVSVVPLQIFSYYMAVFRDCDVDKPRNLAKSVTVE
ncbi:Glutamine--fructose-6-phosphate aminotransferase [isomerizing] [Candidatus Syntrophocurvum alkaliphilum]|uniref:Glutamine--fructose-6-phosphate aminotransferase [isomerizing] n=1 Tax=Candidatus Syntrophocurvum alkaliphilum TaxID=2293317 RepID=A0A6I6DEA2_9FIRM|nr:glutamine--fructose-6-phosphate transaminase (isomerizing) [Candidatus Syntrophocurvum alkaliphilum]QGU00885.1 Glutamine--fructose-6-phosphate aminotransferase [isomerizing] [Candidatus Syntrophocurvum alkaliphilum]